jgi:F-type H+-transporting ATPase subunit epsilon
LEVLTPQATVFAEVVDAVIVPLPDGWKGILPGHAPFCARLMAGQVLARCKGRERLLATIGGTLAVAGDTVTILTGAAALDRGFETLEQEVRDHAERLAEAEREAEKQFDRVYRQMARTLHRRPGPPT